MAPKASLPRAAAAAGKAAMRKPSAAKPVARSAPKPLEYKTPTRKAVNIPPPPPPSATSRTRNPALILAGITAFAISAYSAQLYVRYQHALKTDPTIDVPADPSARYDVIAPSFDASVDMTEKMMGLESMRRRLVALARGDVCEVSIGTGRNLGFYDWDFVGFRGVGKVRGTEVKRGAVKSFTAVDKSPQMLELAHSKFAEMFPGVLGVRWVVQDACEERLPPPPRNADERSGGKIGKRYDTVVQTMGLCSVGEPVRLLRNLAEALEDDGRILLLEHGRGTWDWVNGVLDGLARTHARDFGCWWNRDIEGIVRDSGLVVEKVERKGFGTNWLLVLKKKGAEEGQQK